MQAPLSQADAKSGGEKVSAKVLFFCRPTPVFLPKAADFKRHDLQGADIQMLPLSEMGAVVAAKVRSRLYHEKSSSRLSSDEWRPK